jgi:hypothetical protein
MPDLGIGELLSIIIPAAVSGTTTGLQLEGVGTGTPQKDAQAQLQKQELANEQQQQKQQQEALQQAFKHFAPDAQAATGGSLSDKSFASLVAELSGQPGDISQAQQTIFGNTGSTTGSGLASG